MSDDAKFTRVIRINIVGGSVLLALLGLSIVLMAVGFLPSDAGSILRMLVFGGVPTFLLFLTAWLARRERAEARAASQMRPADRPVLR